MGSLALLASFALSFGGPEPNIGIADLSFLNERPAGAAGRITAQDGHFLNGKGRRLRQVRLDRAEDGLVLEINDSDETVWFELVHE